MTDKEKMFLVITTYAAKGAYLYKQSRKDDGEHAPITCYWDGYKDCAEGLMRELTALCSADISGREGLARKIIQIIDASGDDNIDTIKTIETYCAKEIDKQTTNFDKALKKGDNVIYNVELGCRVNLSQLNRVAKKGLTFSAILRLLDMVAPTDRAKTYCSMLADAMEKEGYTTDASLIKDRIREMNGEKIGLATMDAEKAAKENAKIERADDTVAGYDMNRAMGFVEGAKWYKEQLMKYASIVEMGSSANTVYAAVQEQQLKCGDKVVVIKEDYV